MPSLFEYNRVNCESPVQCQNVVATIGRPCYLVTS